MSKKNPSWGGRFTKKPSQIAQNFEIRGGRSEIVGILSQNPRISDPPPLQIAQNFEIRGIDQKGRGSTSFNYPDGSPNFRREQYFYLNNQDK